MKNLVAEDVRKSARLRPRLDHDLPMPPAQALRRLGQCLANAECRCVGTVVDHHVELLIKPRYRHFWSPWFSGEVRPRGETHAGLHGRFGPHPAIWTGFAAVYAVCVFLALGAGVYGLAQWTLGRDPWSWLLIPGVLSLAAVPYVAARIGRRLATEQMRWMLRFFDCALDGEKQCGEGRCVSCPLWGSPLRDG